MLNTVGLELTRRVNSGSSLKVSKASRRSSRRARRSVEKVPEKPADSVCVNLGSSNMPISKSEKRQGNVLDCHSSDKLEHLPIKKRRFMYRSPSPPPKVPSPVNDENPSFTKNQNDLVQSPVACPISYMSELGDLSVVKEDVQSNYLKKGNQNLESNQDLSKFSGISMLAAAACSSSLGGEFGYAEDGSGVEEPSVHEGPVDVVTNNEAESFSKGLVKEEIVSISDISVGGTSSCVTTALVGEFAAISTADCTSRKVENLHKNIKKEPSLEDATPTVSSDISSMRDEDVDGSQKLQSRDDRMHWDLNVVMDAWEDQPLDSKDDEIPDHLSHGSGIAVKCAANKKNVEFHDSLNEPERSMCDDKKNLLDCEPRKLLDQISQGSLIDDFNHKNQFVSMCHMSVSTDCYNSLVNETSPTVKHFDIKKQADNEPTGESSYFDVAAPLFTDQRILSISDRNCTVVSVGAAAMDNTCVSAIDDQAKPIVLPTFDIEKKLMLKSTVSDKLLDDGRQNLKDDRVFGKIYMNSQVNNHTTVENFQMEIANPPRSDYPHESTVTSGTKANNCNSSFNGSEQFEVHVHNEVKMASAEYIEDKLISDTPSDPCSTREFEAAVKLQDDYDSQYEDGELREPTEHEWEDDAVNDKTEHIENVFDNSRYSVTASHDHRDASNADIIYSPSGVANETCPASDMPIFYDNVHGKASSLLEGPASNEMLESNKMPSPNVVRGTDDCYEKGRIYSPATRSPDSEATDTRTGLRLYRRRLVSPIGAPVSHDMPFGDDQVGNRSKLGVAARWDQGSSYIISSERVRYPMQSQPRVPQINAWDRPSDVYRGMKRNYSPYQAPAKPDGDDDTAARENRDDTLYPASYSSRPSTNDDSVADVDAAENIQLSHKLHKGLGSDRLMMSRGRFPRYGRQVDCGAGRGKYHGPPSRDDTFQSSLKYRRPLSQRDRSLSPNDRRGHPFAHQSHSRSPSRSGTRSPDSRSSPRRRSVAGDCGGHFLRHKSRSPNFRPEGRILRMRSPPHHQRFGADRQSGFRPFHRDHMSPPSRWISNRKDEPGHFTFKQRPMLDKSPNRFHPRGERTDHHLDSSRNPRPDPYYRQNTGRFTEMSSSGRPHRLGGNFDNRRRVFGPIHSGRRGYEDGAAKRLHENDDGFVSTSREVAEFHGRGSRDIDNQNEDMPRRFRRDPSFVYERDGKFNSNSNSKQFGFAGMGSSRNIKSGDPYNRSINPGRYNEMNGAGRGHRYVDLHDERRHYKAVYPPRRGEMEGIERRLSHDHDVDDNLPVMQNSCNVDATSHGRNARGIDGNVDDLPIRQREDQQLGFSGQETELGEPNSTDVQVPAEK